MIGSGVFLLPASLAHIGSISLYAWVFTAMGAMAIAFCFAKLGAFMPKTGGPHVYAGAGFGSFIGFQTAFCYWVALWVGNAAIVIALVGYLQPFFSGLVSSSAKLLVECGFLWFITLVNICQVRFSGWLQTIATVGKLVPLLFIAMGGWFWFDSSLLSQSYNVSQMGNLNAFSAAASLCLWAFIGLESASIPAGQVDNPKRNIPLATLLGTLLAALVYIASSCVIMGIVPIAQLQASTAPFALAAKLILGPVGGLIIALAAIVSCFGALNGWVLLQGQVAQGAAEQGMFPKFLAITNRYNMPYVAHIFTSCLITMLLVLTAHRGFLSQFNTVILVATLASVLPYFYTVLAALILKDGQLDLLKTNYEKAIAIFAVAYSFWIILGVGPVVVYYGMGLLLLSFILYAFKHRHYQEQA